MNLKLVVAIGLLSVMSTPLSVVHADETQQVNGVMTTYAKPRYTTPVTVYTNTRGKMQVKNIAYLKASDKIAFNKVIRHQKYGYIKRLNGYVSTNVMNRFKIPNVKRVAESTQANAQNQIKVRYQN